MHEFAEGPAASDAYMALSACKEIYIHQGSLVDSEGAGTDLLNLKQKAFNRGSWAADLGFLSSRRAFTCQFIRKSECGDQEMAQPLLEGTDWYFKREFLRQQRSYARTKPDSAVLNDEVYVVKRLLRRGEDRWCAYAPVSRHRIMDLSNWSVGKMLAIFLARF